jgi:membrane protease YdiL (CAAX protease family)
MLDLKAESNNSIVVILMVLTICVVVPIMEELVFRGWLYSKIAQTKLGDIGALTISSIIFTLIHTQYDNIITFLVIFLLGLLLGFARYKSANISYSIAMHMIFNSLAMVALFFFI